MVGDSTVGVSIVGVRGVAGGFGGSAGGFLRRGASSAAPPASAMTSRTMAKTTYGSMTEILTDAAQTGAHWRPETANRIIETTRSAHLEVRHMAERHEVRSACQPGTSWSEVAG
jgi:hypothetical protein